MYPFRLGTDILFGNNCGLKTVLMLTGISSLEDVKNYQSSSDPSYRKSIPDFYMPSIKELKLPLTSVSSAAS